MSSPVGRWEWRMMFALVMSALVKPLWASFAWLLIAACSAYLDHGESK